MKTTLKTMLLLAGLTLATGLQAQDKKGKDLSPEERATKKTEHLQKKLALTDAQAKKIKTYHLAHAEKMQVLRNEKEGIRKKNKALRAKMKAEKDAHHKAVKQVLTPEQIVKLDDMKKKHHAKRKTKRKKKCANCAHERMKL